MNSEGAPSNDSAQHLAGVDVKRCRDGTSVRETHGVVAEKNVEEQLPAVVAALPAHGLVPRVEREDGLPVVVRSTTGRDAGCRSQAARRVARCRAHGARSTVVAAGLRALPCQRGFSRDGAGGAQFYVGQPHTQRGARIGDVPAAVVSLYRPWWSAQLDPAL
jgi:hypothetical protein